MKKIFLLLLLTGGTFTTFAQKLSIGFRGGVDLGTITGSAQGSSSSNTSNVHLSSIFAGYVDYQKNNLSLQPAVILVGKGGNINIGDGGEGKFALHYLEVPINLVYHLPLRIGDVYFGGGPYLAFGTGGTVVVQAEGVYDSQPATFGGYGDFSRTDAGFEIIGGIRVADNVVFHLNYDFGLSNIINITGQEGGLGTLKTGSFGISFGFVF